MTPPALLTFVFFFEWTKILLYPYHTAISRLDEMVSAFPIGNWKTRIDSGPNDANSAGASSFPVSLERIYLLLLLPFLEEMVHRF